MVAPKFTFEGKITFRNVLTIVTTMTGLIVGYVTLAQSVASSAETVKVIPGIETRVTMIETRVAAWQESSEESRQETKQALRDQAAMLSQIMQTQASILARLDERDRQSSPR